ncbi:hypothetical protein BCR42DRAFT_458664 [Absidia repens]|uniref:Uncharacterized protein n=1 Tax=Absidia repens TaxID=90262 RepID=A0A1X2IW02_9FUNG|nr:hypothetical protein BCR42DRAFT_458664 [Absidia repens]
MGATQSKSSEPVIFYNQNVPLQSSKSTSTTGSSEDVESVVRQRVAEELEKVHQQQQELNQQIYGDMAKQNIDNDRSSVALGTDIDSMIKRIQRSSPKDIPADIAERQEALVLCYK